MGQLPARMGPATFEQTRLWLQEQTHPGQVAYNESYLIWIEGPLDAAVMQRSLETLVVRHEVLRTRLEERNGQCWQIVGEPYGIELEVQDVSDDAAVRARARALARLPFDFEQGQFLRARLFRQTANRHGLALGFHHVASDGWSVPLLINELWDLYQAAMRDLPTNLFEPPLQYLDHAEHQRRHSVTGALPSRLDHWRRLLCDAPAETELPGDRSRPSKRTFEGEREPIAIEVEQVEALRRVGAPVGATLNMVLLAGLAALLHRYTGQPEVVIAVPIATRDEPGFDRIIGYLGNTVPVRLAVETASTFTALVEHVRDALLDAYEHGDVPFEAIASELRLRTDLSRSPLTQVMFNPQLARPHLTGGGLRWSVETICNGTSKLDLTLGIWEEADQYEGYLEYATDLYDPTTVHRVWNHLLRLLDSAAADPARPVRELVLMAPSELAQIEAWNLTRLAFEPEQCCLHELVEAQARRTPERPAVVQGDCSLTYAELDRRASALSDRLRRLGADRGSLIGVLLERTPDLLVALLAILKAGAAYVPIDPQYPAERMRFMLEDSGARLVLTEPSQRSRLPPTVQAVLLGEAPGDDAKPEIGGAACPDDLAYVIYTSGSTGRPKGVMVQHRAVVNLLRSMARKPGLGADDVVLALTTPSFDIAVVELFLPLIVGARIVLAGSEVVRDGMQLAALLDASPVTVMQATPATWRMLIDIGWRGSPHLRVLCGGEALPPGLAEQILDRTAELTNGYGPTETAVYSTFDRILRGAAITIGAPIANTQAHVLDRDLRPVPVGVAGELWIGGAGVARGYHGRPGLTAERFFPDPFGRAPGDRLYRTGDLVRRCQDGRLEYLGRLDHQVKLRGFRIELGEVEVALASCPGVREAVAVVREDEPGERRLVGYVRTPGGTDVREIVASRLRALLPDYMVPSVVVELTAFPRLPNGKIDRRALPPPVIESEADFVAPRSEFEQTVAAVWCDVLKVDSVGTHDDFFALGGDSLKIVTCVYRLAAIHGVRLPIRQVMQATTLAGMAATLSDARHTRAVSLRRGRRTAIGPLTPVQQGVYALCHANPGLVAYNIPFRVRMIGNVDPVRLERALVELMHRHGSLRTHFEIRGAAVRQVVEDGPAFELERWSGLGEPFAGFVRPFALGRSPLFRARLAVGPDVTDLYVDVHHLVFDGFSLERFVDDLIDLYTGVSVPPLPCEYLDAADWLHERLEAELPDLEEYWLEAFAAPPPPVAASIGRHRRPWPGGRGDVTTRRLTGPGRDRLRELSRATGATLFSLLLAAYAVSLARISGRDDLVIGFPSNGRAHPDMEPLIGMFVNMVCVRAQLWRGATFRQAFEQLAARCRDALVHEGYPLDRLVRKLGLERDFDRRGLFDVLFALHAMEHHHFSRPGLDATVEILYPGMSQFDLDLHVYDRPEGLRMDLDYSAELFDRRSADYLATRYLGLLENLLAGEDPPVFPVERSRSLTNKVAEFRF